MPLWWRAVVPSGEAIAGAMGVAVLRSEGTIEKPNLPDVPGGDFRIGDLLVAAARPDRLMMHRT